MIKIPQTISERNSAIGTASQIPFTPIIKGSTTNPIMTKTNVRMKEIVADTFPFDKAVNSIDANILNPMNKKLILNNLNPSVAITYISLPSAAINFIK